MIDFVKIAYNCWDDHFFEWLVNHPLLDFECVVSEKTGEVKSDFLLAKYRNLKFILYNGMPNGHNGRRLYIQGSLHKYFNGGIHNYNDFTYVNFKDTIAELEQVFNLDPSLCILQNVEIGVNLSLVFPVGLVLNNLLVYRAKGFIKCLYHNYYQCVRDRYSVKIYDKGKQYGLGENVLRFEIKYTKMADLNCQGIFNVSDFLDLKGWELAKGLLLDRWEGVLFFDTSISRDGLSRAQAKKLPYYSNPHFWRDITDRKKRFFHVKCYREMLRGISQNKHEIIKSGIVKKWAVLTGNST